MAQTVTDIKAVMTTKFMANEDIATKYGFVVGANFEQTFSKVSLESIIFYIVAYSVWLLQCLFDTHEANMNELILTKKPHNRRWYRDKTLAFRFGRALNPDTDEYNLAGIDEQTITGELVVKYASAFEYQGRVFIKVAGGSDTAKEKLTLDQETALNEYLSEIKDAGVFIGKDNTKKTKVINEDADHFALTIKIWYDPLVLDATGKSLSIGTYPVKNAITDFVQNRIPFNGEYKNMSLVDVLQKTEGVVIPELTLAQECSASDFDAAQTANETIPWQPITAKAIPESGYYKIYDETADLHIEYIPYQTIESV